MIPLRSSATEGGALVRPQHDPQPQYDARDLVGEGPTASIALDGQIYTLRITRSGKLILTK
ncbi:MAG: hemin uptake protein HemP [Roseovarius sp.]|nr:hemin uptake protein HemP [Roseovarius sp.]